MLFWMAISVFGFSIGLIWHNSIQRKRDQELKLKKIQGELAARKKATKKSNSEIRGIDE